MPGQVSKKGKMMPFKWEEGNHGLDHKCGTCKTVLSSPRAKKSCLGIHEFPCWAYHNTLFFKGQAHTCEACHTMREQSHKRVREIVSLAKAIQDLEAAALAQGKTVSRKRSSSALTTPPSEPVAPDAIARAHSFPGAGKSKRERKAQKSAAPRTTTVDIVAPAELDRAKDLLVAAAAAAAATSEDKKAGESPPLKGRQRVKSGSPSPPPDQALEGILADLGLPRGATAASAKLVKGLRAAVGAHLEVLRNEDEEFEMRREGFEAYVTRRALDGVAEMHAEFDCVTGEKKDPKEDGAEAAGMVVLEGDGDEER